MKTKKLTPEEFKSKNVQLFRELYQKIKDIELTTDDEKKHYQILKTIIVDSKKHFRYVNDYCWWQEIIPALAWMKINDIDDIDDSWFNDGVESQWEILDFQFLGAKFLRVFFETYCVAKNLRAVLDDNDFLSDDTDVKLSKSDMLLLLS